MGNFETTELLRQVRLSHIRESYGVLGNVYIVIASGESWLTSATKAFNLTYPDGSQVIHNTLATAKAAMVSGRNDLCLLDSNTAHAMSALMDLSQSRMNFLGISKEGRKYGQRARVTMGVTTSALDIATIKNTGVGNSFENIKFDSSNTKDESLYSVAEGGEYAIYKNCEFCKSTDLNEDSAAELLCNGDGAQFIDCTFGSLANAITASGARPVVLFDRETIAGKVARIVTFKGCNFLYKAGATANRIMYGSGATDIERSCLIEDCLLHNAILAGNDPAQAIAFGSSQTEGRVIIKGSTMSVGCTKLSTTIGVETAGAAVDSGAGIAVNAA